VPRKETATNFIKPDTLNTQVHLKTKHEPCSWKKHCASGSIFRDVLGLLEFEAKRNSQRFIFKSIPKLLKKCSGEYRKGGARPVSRAAFMRVLRDLWAMGILSPYCTMLVDLDDGSSQYRKGYVLAPHDFMTRRFDRTCSVQKPGPEIFPHVRRRADGSITGLKMWLPQYGGIETELRPARDRSETELRPSRDRAETAHETAGETAGETAHSEQLVEPQEPIVESEKVLQSVLQSVLPLPLIPVSPSYPIKAFSNPLTPIKNGDQASDEENQKQEGRETPNTSSSFYDRPTKPANMVSTQTVAQYFNGVSDEELIYRLTDGQLDSREPVSQDPRFALVAGTPVRYGHDAALKYDHWTELIAACRAAIKQRDTHEMKDRVTLSRVMRDAMKLLKAKHGVNTPKPWLKIIDDLKGGGKLAVSPVRVEQEPTGTGTPPLFQGFGLEEFVEELVPFGYDRFKGFRDGWKFLHELLEKRGDKPAAMIAARDKMYERDVAPEKPPAPWNRKC
jgi:hypothetical protein